MKSFTLVKINFTAFAVFLCLTLAAQNVMARQALDKIVAVINDDVITQNELNDRVSDFIVQLKLDRNDSSQINALTSQVLERMISTRIQLQMADQMGITIDDISLNRMIEQIAQSNGMSIDQLRSTLEADGIKFSRFREQTREELIIKQLQQRLVASKVSISEQETQRFIETNLNKTDKHEKYLIQHLLIATPESASPDAISKANEKAQQLLTEIKNGADFNTLAIHQSDGRNALKGGDLGWRTASELPESFVAAIQQLEKGETSEPVHSASGFHLLKLLDRSSNTDMITQTLARHILIRTSNETSDDEARALLTQLKNRIQQGEDFATLASEYSDDPGSKVKGGDLGWADPGTFVTEFEDVMDNLKNQEVSNPFRSQFGWHILQVLDRRDQDKTQDNLKAQASKVIHKRKYDEELNLWLRRIRDEAYVEYIDRTPEQ
ncbi:MAG: peptidylprolyl isomerase [Gammaproteobacteria bacterium]|nr:peptidylprolyl isomerase [Gammaproteobacteria bacterium]